MGSQRRYQGAFMFKLVREMAKGMGCVQYVVQRGALDGQPVQQRGGMRYYF